MQETIEQASTPTLFPPTQEQEETQKKLQLVLSTIAYAGRRGCDLSIVTPRLLGCWTRIVDGRLVPTF